MPDRLTGTVTLHNANWKTDALPTAVGIAQATLHLGGGASIWDGVVFAYGPLIGTARLEIPVCGAADEGQCVPTVNLEFPSLDAAELQTTLLGAEKKGTLLSTVIARLTPSAKHEWPAFQGTVKADSLELGPVTLEDFVAILKVSTASAEITSADAGMLGGQIHLTGKIESGDKPGYSLDGSVKKVNPADLCRVMELKCTGASFDGDGKAGNGRIHRQRPGKLGEGRTALRLEERCDQRAYWVFGGECSAGGDSVRSLERRCRNCEWRHNSERKPGAAGCSQGVSERVGFIG